jgi:glycosyltransferase involved in cell wall biosynthesis
MHDLIVFSHLRWDFVFQRPQHLLSRLARTRRIFFVEEPVQAEGQPFFEVMNPCDGVQVLRPHTPIDAPGFHDKQIAALQVLLAAWLRAANVNDYAVWFYMPMALPLLAHLKPAAVVYDCMDELSAFAGAPRQMRQRESALIKAADVVFTGGPSLYEAKRDSHPNVHCLPSAVDARHYAPASQPVSTEVAQAVHALQAGIPGPRLGFFGVIDERMDLDLLAAVADARPDWQLVMVGPIVKIDPQQVPQRKNIHWLGKQTYDALPLLVKEWDVCLLPFALNEATRFISPTKTLEYMAAEKPVVSTAVRDVSVLYGDVVRVAQNADEFIAHCSAALAESAEEAVQRIEAMQGRVARYSWDNTAGEIEELLAQAITERTLAPRTAPYNLHAVEPAAAGVKAAATKAAAAA